jgi:hypothetical protein
MSAAENEILGFEAPVKRRAYDPDNLHPLDEEARKYDDNSEGIDWDEIIATTEDDFQAGRFAFNSEDYPTHEEAMKAFKRWTRGILEEVRREREARRVSVSSRDATGAR